MAAFHRGSRMVVRRLSATVMRLAAAGLAAALLAGCQASDFPKAAQPVPHALVADMDKLNMKATAPIFIRIFKEESQLEVWKQTRSGTYALLKTYDICKWSGDLGPKKYEGDRQAPEGFYTVTPAQMNPNSNYYLSFNIGYPNAYDRSLGRTGSNLMVHGACSSAGCYSMTDESAGELFALARDAFRGGQKAFQIQAFPFRMTPENLASHRDNPNMDFWRMLKVGYDSFDLTHRPPEVDVCDHKYVFNAEAGSARFDPSAACPVYQVPQALAVALAKKQAADDQKYAVAVAALEQQEQQEAKAQQIADAKAAAKEERQAARQEQPSLITRWLGGGGNTSTSAAPATAAAAPVTVPMPRVAPTSSRPAAAVAATSTSPPAAAQTPASKVGQFIKRKFWWWSDDSNATPASDTQG
jgi:murein L,D-transpeptidase YafK